MRTALDQRGCRAPECDPLTEISHGAEGGIVRQGRESKLVSYLRCILGSPRHDV